MRAAEAEDGAAGAAVDAGEAATTAGPVTGSARTAATTASRLALNATAARPPSPRARAAAAALSAEAEATEEVAATKVGAEATAAAAATEEEAEAAATTAAPETGESRRRVPTSLCSPPRGTVVIRNASLKASRRNRSFASLALTPDPRSVARKARVFPCVNEDFFWVQLANGNYSCKKKKIARLFSE